MKCDVCSEGTDGESGYILTTSEVVYDPGYWKRALTLLPASAQQLDPGLPQFVRQMSSSETDWVLCEECMSFLKAERSSAAERYADYVRTGKRPRLPNSGPANLELAATVATGAFQTVFGRPPRSIRLEQFRLEQSSGEILGSVEFSEKLAKAARSGDREALAWLGGVQVKCGACHSVMPAVECQTTATGMSCPRCDQPWFLIK